VGVCGQHDFRLLAHGGTPETTSTVPPAQHELP
jgi:hypothetical protein